MKATFSQLQLFFKRPAGTSRGFMHLKNSWILSLTDGKSSGMGEISVIEGLSPEFKDLKSFEQKIERLCHFINTDQHTQFADFLHDLPSIKFGYESALLDLQHGGKGILFNNDFSNGIRKIPINGLVWMGDPSFMQEQIEQKIAEGYTTIKMKIGAIDLSTELQLLESIRENYSVDQIILRVDANGAFSFDQAKNVLGKLAELEIHSIEQPIKAGRWEEMTTLCRISPTPIALDEELIGISDILEKERLLDTIQPPFIILKPSLHGGISGTKEWIELAEKRHIQWWMTSALESNIGLNAICQLAGEYDNVLPQGLGTGSLYTNNVESDLVVEKGFIFKGVRSA